MRKPDVIILSHHPLFLYGLTTVIENSKNYTVTAYCRAESDFLAALSKTRAAIAILDCSSFSSSAMVSRLLRGVAEMYPDLKLMLVGENRWHKKLAASLYPFITDYVCKTQDARQFLKALAQADTSQYRAYDIVHADSERTGGRAFVTPEYQISEKEYQIIRLIHSGLTVSEVAARVNRSVKTISSQKRSAMKKLGLKRDKDLFTLEL